MDQDKNEDTPKIPAHNNWARKPGNTLKHDQDPTVVPIPPAYPHKPEQRPVTGT